MADPNQQKKREKIERMLAMQRQFIELDQAQGVEMRDYFAPREGEPLEGYREAYTTLAMDVVDEAHAIVGSKRD